MTGLDQMLKVIEEDAQVKADAIISEAKRTAEEMMTAAKQEAEAKCAQIAEKTAADVNGIIRRAESAALLQEKRIILEAKQQIINSIIKKATESLATASDSEFTEIILSMVKQYAHNMPGRIHFSPADRKRLPKDIDERLNAALSMKKFASLQVSEDRANLESGFLLVYGDIEENCSFDALFAAERDNLLDKANSLLFE